MHKTHLKNYARKAISVIMTTLAVLSLTACGSNAANGNGNNSNGNSKNEASEQVKKTDYTISEFFSEAPFKVLYVAKTPITKDSKLSEIWVLENGKIEIFTGNGVIDYREGAELSSNPLPKEVSDLTISDISKMTDEEVVNYYRNIPNLIAGYDKVYYGRSDYIPHAIYDYQIHAFTDGSGNNINSEFLVVNNTSESTVTAKYNPKLSDAEYDYDYSTTKEVEIKYTETKAEIYELIPFSNNFTIYNENFTTVLALKDNNSVQLFARNSDMSAINTRKDTTDCSSIIIDPTSDQCAKDSRTLSKDYSNYGYFPDGYPDAYTKKYTDLSDYKKHSEY